MNARSKKNKGNRFENLLIDIFRKQLDCNAHRTPGSGSGLDKNDIVLPNYNIEIEAKNAKTYKLGHDWEQLKRQTTSVNTGVLAIRNPKKAEGEETLVVMELGDFIELVKGKDNEPAVVELPQDIKWRFKRVKDAVHDVMKYL